MNTETGKETINVSRKQREKECPGGQKRREKSIHTNTTSTGSNKGTDKHTDLVEGNGLPVQWAADWHVSCFQVNGEETFGILVSTGACQSEDMVPWLLCWNHLQTHTHSLTTRTIVSVSHLILSQPISWSKELVNYCFCKKEKKKKSFFEAQRD